MNRVPIVALLGANAISLVGSTLTMLALPWFVLQTTGSPARAGLTGFFVALPAFVVGVFGGTFVDRLGYKRVSVTADLVSGVAIALIPLLYQVAGLAFWQLLALVFAASLLEIPGLTARRAMLPELAELGRLRLERVNASFESIQQLSLLLGAPLAGLLIASLGASNVLWVDAATFIASAAIVALAVPGSPIPKALRTANRYIHELAEGLRFLRRDRLLFALAISLALTNCLGAPIFAVILPVYAQSTLGSATALGLMVAASGIGALAGALIYGAIGHRWPRRATWIGGFMVNTLPLWALVTTPSLPVIAGALAISGVAGGLVSPLLVTIRHERIPAQLRGRVFSTFSAITAVAQPIGALLGGSMIESLGFRTSLLVIALCSQAASVGMLFIPAFRDMNRPGNAPEDRAQAEPVDS